ncbi:DegT/DnrJ/EryC1/StrS family aminotransferase [Candidatus Daviesbacteria bacterium]|nr:DegT/DnrJ/EryC1/StrS family aminotransferase [Candidatus Daviesbacteria bacterium]
MQQVKFNDFITEGEKHQKEFENAFGQVLKSGWYILGKEVADFEKEFANYLGVKHCIGVGNGLEALQISIMALGIGEGDEIITTPISAVATTLAILATGAKPIFVDTDQFGLLDVNLIESKINKKTKAILPVHLYGNAVNLQKLKRLVKKHHLYLIEDACQAHGASFGKKKLGSLSDLGCFSFYPTKNLGALGDGGAIVTNSGKLAKICREIRDYGQKDRYNHTRFGLNSRLDELQAALLKVKLQYLDQDNEKRRKLAGRYIKNLAGLSGIEIIKPQNLAEGNFHLFVIKTKKRNALQKFLKENGIPTLIHYPKTIPDQTFLKTKKVHQDLENARVFVKRTLSLPCHPYMEIEQVDFICQKIKGFFN